MLQKIFRFFSGGSWAYYEVCVRQFNIAVFVVTYVCIWNWNLPFPFQYCSLLYRIFCMDMNTRHRYETDTGYPWNVGYISLMSMHPFVHLFNQLGNTQCPESWHGSILHTCCSWRRSVSYVSDTGLILTLKCVL